MAFYDENWLIKKKDKLWVRVLRSKYKCVHTNLPRIVKKRDCSNVWKKEVQAWSYLKNGLAWNLRDEMDIYSRRIKGFQI